MYVYACTHCYDTLYTHTHSHTPYTLIAGGGPPKLIHMIHSSEYPQTTFAVLDSMKCLVGENSLDYIFVNLRQFYNPKKGQKIEVKGYCYEAKGYVVKVGSIVIGSTNKGLIVEVSHTLYHTVELLYCGHPWDS